MVADNGSDDGTAALVREQFPDATLIQLGQNLGFGRAVNRAVAEGSAEAIVVLNNDVSVESSFLAEIVTPLQDASVGMVSGVLLDPRTGLIDAAGVEIDDSLAGHAYLKDSDLQALDRPPEGLLGPCGGAAAYRRSAFEAVGGFDQRMFAYSEDLELALRLRAAGWRCELSGGARGLHLGSATLGARTVAQARHAGHSRGYVMGRYRVGFGWLAVESMIGLADAVALRSFVPMRARVAGWRMGRAEHALPVPERAVSPALRPAQAFRRRWRAAFPRA
jgi:N-acetylglucosaminyl-diphospho-decaprenol L-rhamnosyltransferase